MLDLNRSIFVTRYRFNPLDPIQRLRQLRQKPKSSCPPENTFCGNKPIHDFSSKCFDSIKEARAFLTYKVPELSKAECLQNSEKIRRAEKMVQKADRRNQRRKTGRNGKSDLNLIKKPVKEITRYEETLGPDGEVIRFKLIIAENTYKNRVRTKEEPPIGSIILDLTSGIKAWKRFSDKRRSIPLTSEMRRSYQNSFLFKVRQLAAGKINLQQFLMAIKGKKSGKLQRKNKRNRK